MQYILHTLRSLIVEIAERSLINYFTVWFYFCYGFVTAHECDAMLTNGFYYFAFFLFVLLLKHSIVYQIVRRKWVLAKSKEKFFPEDFISFNFSYFVKLQSFCEFISKFCQFSGQLRLVTHLQFVVAYVLNRLHFATRNGLNIRFNWHFDEFMHKITGHVAADY